MDKLKMQTANKADENFKKLAEMFPNAVTETITGYDENGKAIVERAIDKDVLMQEISCEVVEGNEERYQFTWPDKKKSVLLANAPINKTLRPVRDDETTPTGADSEGKPYCSSGSVNFDNTENLYIEGDNLEVLKLLQETYLGKIKMIYIDPPYNTGSDFIYRDDFSESADEYLANSGQFDEDGYRLFQNTENNGRIHTNWLNMIYPRLKLAKDLLSEDGVIFISIDDNEVVNLKKVCDEIFGVANFEVDLHVKVRHEKRILREDIRYQLCMEHILCYRKNEYSPNRLPKEKNASDDYCWDVVTTDAPKEIIELGGYKIEVYDSKSWTAKNVGAGNGKLKEYQIRGSLITQKGSASEFYEIYLRERREKDGEGTLYKVIGMGVKGDGLGYRYIRQPNDFSFKNGFYYQGKPLSSTESKGLPYPNFWDFVVESNNVGEEGGIEYKGGKKPVALIEKVMELAGIQNEKNAIIIDFFSGSATTAHAVMNYNRDGGNRKFIMVQLPEDLDDAYQKASPKNKASLKNTLDFLDKHNKPHIISELGKIRIALCGESLKDKVSDVGFRVLKCDSSNMKDVYYNPAEYESSLFSSLEDNIKEDRTPEDLLFQVMLDLGILLSSKIQVRSEKVGIRNYSYFDVEDGYLIACFDKNIDEEVITAIAKQKPYYFVMRDSSMANDSVATNFEQIFATYSPDTVRKVL